MATVVLGNGSVNFAKDNSFAALSLVGGAKYESATDSMFSIRGTDGSREVFKGQFTVVPSAVAANSANGVSGFVTAYERYATDGQLAYSVTGIQQTTTAFDAIKYYSPADVADRAIFENTNILFIGTDTVTGGNGNDVFLKNSGNDVIDGGAGTDAVYLRKADVNAMDSQSFKRTATNEFTLDIGGYKQVYKNVERIIMEDGTSTSVVAMDMSGSAGQAYRLYQAAFNRTPDSGGLGYQVNALDKGVSLTQVAQNFINSPEFAATYGSLNTQQFVTQLYQNVLHRAPDAGGLTYHVDNLSNGVTRAQTLVGFSESPENQEAIVKLIGSAMSFDYYQG